MIFRQPNLSPLPDRNQYLVLDDYLAEYGDLKIVVPADFIFDGASVPFFGWLPTYTPFHPDVMAPALLHDWLYLNHQVDRKTADQIFYDFLVLNGAGKFKAKLMHKGVRIGGGPHFGYCQDDIDKLDMLYDVTRARPNFDEYHFPLDVIGKAAA